jgi:dihydroxyacetone kinase-like protein
MRASITSEDWIAIFQKMADDLEAASDQLNALDAAVGDGDQGVTMTIGFRAVRDALPGLRGQDVGTIISRVGLAFNGKAASTIGALLATGCMRAGREARGKQEVDLADLARMVEAALAGIKERGKAEVGDKTVLETLVPLSQALSADAAEGLLLVEALQHSLAAAEEGMKSTIPLRSKIGRASWLADRTVGHQDPGATSFYLMWKSTVDYLTST